VRIALIALIDEHTSVELDLEDVVASALDATAMCFRDMEEAKAAGGAEGVDAVLVRCSAETTDPGALIGEIRAIWTEVPVIVVSSPGADESAISAASLGVDAWILEDQRCGLRVVAALTRAVEQNLRRRQLLALNATAAGVNGSLDLVAFLDIALDQVLWGLRVEVSGIFLFEGDPPLLRLRACRGLSDDLVGAASELRAGEILSESILASAQPLLLDDIAADARPVSESLAAEGFRFFAGVPLHAGGRTTGVLWVLSRSRPSHLDLMPFLTTLGNQVAAAIENARLYREAKAASMEWEATFDAIEDGIAIVDGEHTILRANRAFARLIGKSSASLIGAKCYALVHGAQAPPEDCPCRRLQRGEPAGLMDFQAPGSEREFICSSYPRCRPEGHFEGMVHVFRDVTDARRLQERMAQADRLAAIGELVAGVAHELNNPLSVVGGLSEYLLRQGGALPPQVRDDLSAIAHEAARAGRIVQNLLAFSRQTPMTLEPVDLRDCLQRSLELLDYQFRVDDIRVETDLHPDLPHVMGDGGRLQQALVNLLSNAHHALSRVGGGLICVRAAPQGEMVRLEIADTGPGIPEEHLGRIFDPFFTTKEVGEGTGLGLSICHGIVAEHGGRIELANRPGGGAAATVELARAPESAEAPPPSQPRLAPAVSAARVLVVDDEPFVRRFMLRTLETAGHEVAAACSAEEALDRVRGQPFDVVICDLKMPGLGGRGLHRTLIEEHAELAERIVFCTGDTARRSTHAFLEEAGMPHLVKPFTSQELLDAVRQRREFQGHPGEDTTP